MDNYIFYNGRKIHLDKDQAARLAEEYRPADVKLADIPAGSIFEIGTREFVVLEHLENGGTAVILLDLLRDDIKFGNNNNFAGSDVDNACMEFAEELTELVGEEDLLEHEVDLISLDGLDDYGTVRRKVSVLTLNQYRKYVRILDQHNPKKWQWLATPSSTPAHEIYRWILCVSPSGRVYIDYCRVIGFCVRPFCIFKSDTFVSRKE